MDRKILLGRSLLEKLAGPSLCKVQGLAKLEKKVLILCTWGNSQHLQVRQEVKFLEKFEKPANFSNLKKEHIACSNLAHQVGRLHHCFNLLGLTVPRHVSYLFLFEIISTLSQASVIGALVSVERPSAVLQPFSVASKSKDCSPFVPLLYTTKLLGLIYFLRKSWIWGLKLTSKYILSINGVKHLICR